MKGELLAPAGSYEALEAAFEAGADAVYLGGQKFGARAYADNLDQEQLIRAIDLAHLKGKQLYLTINTLLKNRELEEELGIHAEPTDLQFAGKFPISFAREFHGKIFRDEEIAFVYIYDHPVEIDHLTLQKEEVEEVQWFDLEETYQQCSQHRDKFCVPLGGLQLVRQFIKSNSNTIKE